MVNDSIKKCEHNLTILEKALFGVSIKKIYLLLPGLFVSVIIAFLSIFLSHLIGNKVFGIDKSPISPVMIAIILGMIIRNLVVLPALLNPGFTFVIKKLLRLGIIFLGIRLSIIEVFKLGVLGIPIVIICILGGLIFTILLSKWFKLPERIGTLIATGTSICGVSAIVATGPAIGAKEEEIAYSVAIITIFGMFATLVYPFLSNFIFSGESTKISLFLGTAIQDTSQVTGAALVYNDMYSQPQVIDLAIITKLVRNVFMIFVIPFMSFYYSHKESKKDQYTMKKIRILKLFPVFVLGFLLFAILRSTGDVCINSGNRAFGFLNNESWIDLYNLIKNMAVNFLVVALSGVGLNTDFKKFKGLGIKPFIVGFGAAIIVGLISFTMIYLIV